jgi:flagellar biosynthesis/type III secretory pathway chaperone
MESRTVEDLTDILETEIELLRRLHALLAEEQAALVRGDVEKIRETVEGQIGVLSEISGLEDKRLSALAVLSPNGASPEETKLQRIIEAAPQYAARLTSVRNALREVLEAIGAINGHNGMLINQSLSYIDRTLKSIAGEDPSSKVYTDRGELRCRTGRIAVDREV